MGIRKILLNSIFILFCMTCICQDYWESIYSSEEGIYSIAINSQNDMFLSVYGSLLRSIDGGYSWEVISAGGISTCIDENDTIYRGPAPMYYSINNGDDWISLNFPGMSADYIYIDSQHNIHVGFWGGIYKTSDNGVTWDLTYSVSDMEVINQIVETEEGYLFAGTIDFIGIQGGVYRSVDFGDSWQYYGLHYHYISSLAVNSDGEIFAGSRGHHSNYHGGVYRSSDNGETWVELRNDVLVTSLAIDSEDKIFIGCSDLNGMNASVHVSEDNGENWQIIQSEIMPSDIGIEYLTISDNDILYAISYETVRHVYRSVQATTNIIENSIPPGKAIELTNFPNPFNPYTTIQFSGEAFEPNKVIILEIYNIKGQRVKQFKLENEKWKMNEIIWGGKDEFGNPVSSGVYLYQIKSNDFISKIKKMILCK